MFLRLHQSRVAVGLLWASGGKLILLDDVVAAAQLPQGNELGLTIKGAMELVDMYVDGKIDLDGFVSHRLTLDEVNKGFELMEAQDGIRSVIEFGA